MTKFKKVSEVIGEACEVIGEACEMTGQAREVMGQALPTELTSPGLPGGQAGWVGSTLGQVLRLQTVGLALLCSVDLLGFLLAPPVSL